MSLYLSNKCKQTRDKNWLKNLPDTVIVYHNDIRGYYKILYQSPKTDYEFFDIGSDWDTIAYKNKTKITKKILLELLDY